MSEKSKIQWCDSTANFWTGCTKVSDGCKLCYAETRDKRHLIEKVDHWGKGAPRLKSKSAVKDCLAWNKLPWICDKCGKAYRSTMHEGAFELCLHGNKSNLHRRRVFSLSLGDWLDAEVPIEWLAEMLNTIRQCDQLIFILCTKRPELWRERLLSVLEYLHNMARAGGLGERVELDQVEHEEFTDWLNGWLDIMPPQNIWLLTSVENQKAADERIPELLKIPAVLHGLSMEPLLEAVNIEKWLGEFELMSFGAKGHNMAGGIRWVIMGGESGPGARPCNVEWLRSIIEQCREFGASPFVKQLGSNPFSSVGWTGPLKMITDKKGGDINEWPKDLQVRAQPLIRGV